MNLIDLIGNTPLIDLSFLFPRKPAVSVFAKAEWMNPGGSIKDRPVKRMLTEAVAAGKLNHGKIILDSSSGNAGIAYAMIGAALGYKVSIVVPGNASLERKQRIAVHGAQLIETDPMEGYDEAMKEARRLYEVYPEKYFFCDQYSNENNWLAHYEGTAVEILSQVDRPIDHFICGVGTGGTITGIGRRLKEAFPGITVWCIRPELWPGIEGLKPLDSQDDIIPEIFDETIVDEWIDITSEEAKLWCRELGKNGWFTGQSSGAYLAACEKVISQIQSGTVLTLLKDLGERYFSAGLWRNETENTITEKNY
ncbi:cysteine synthase family protein [candidate division KSB1 bacterium]|nr:cysteine synthase family protein [candidate division KSB1 bacterium]